jgi:hypothetical protein
VRFTPVARDRQATAVRFLNENAFTTPGWAIKPEILRRIEPVGVLERVRTGQQSVLESLLSSARLRRLVEQEALDPETAYRPLDFLADLRKGIWSEFYGTTVQEVNAYRRNLQRAYIETLADRIHGAQAAVDDARAFFRGELKTLGSDLETALNRTTDRATRLHIEDVHSQIARALDSSVQKTAAVAAPPGDLADPFDPSIAPDSCWIDYSIGVSRPASGPDRQRASSRPPGGA